MFWAAVFHRKEEGRRRDARQFGYNMPLELVLTVIPFIIISVLFYFTVVVQQKMPPRPQPEVVVDVTAFQWNWKFGYQKVAFRRRIASPTVPTRPARPRWSPSRRASTPTARRRSVRGLNPRGPHLSQHDKVEDPGHSARSRCWWLPPASGARVPGGLRRRHPLVLGAGVPVQARRVPDPAAQPLEKSSRSEITGRRPARSSGVAPRCAAPTTR